ncbi:NAD(P)/FAD-dependent oxidoreductase [Pseudotamlana carrageenivorans]|uniref:Pyridine nucleotide-disulfide oxidoreductase n=1 Tax=Pseudotamlana carrageenivorans TaxID=2069432 RepID=A0A2I7SJP2_9FLAO|nr:NAD(P)/FAD-dependent oxidoreductase [Tamlana carrageenivorans]AUS06112.1 pyridine nucleotide-disulfide oxidoreductase [Tamlana carrageenivorans]
MTNNNFEVIIIGGGYAGLSAALSLGRSLRKVLIIEGNSPSANKRSKFSYNFITQDGIKPESILKQAKDQILKYDTLKFISDIAISVQKSNDLCFINTFSGHKFNSKKIIFATGIKYIYPKIKGFSECWGVSIIHCSGCHGYEFKNKKTAILANGDSAFMFISIVLNLTDKISILTNGESSFSPMQLEKLNSRKIQIIESKIKEIQHVEGVIKNVVFDNNISSDFEVLYAFPELNQKSELPSKLGCQFTDDGLIKVDSYNRTTVNGVYACGDNSSDRRSISNAVVNGHLAGATVNLELSIESF